MQKNNLKDTPDTNTTASGVRVFIISMGSLLIVMHLLLLINGWDIITNLF